MSKQRRSKCRVCGVSGNDTPISRSGRCGACSEAALLDHNRSQQMHVGAGYDKWARAYMAAAHARAASAAHADTSSD